MPELSEAIVSAPVILLTGAGASAPLGKATTEAFMDHATELLTDDLRGVFEHLRASCTPCQGLEVVDIEVILDQLATCIESSDTLQEDPFFGRLLFQTDPPRNQLQELVRTYTRLRDALLDEVVRHYGDVTQTAATSLYRPILLKMPQQLKAWTLPVFTLNYDLAIESAADGLGVRLVDGINRRSVVNRGWSAGQFDSFPGYRSPTVVLFKLHGSVSWCTGEDGNIREVAGLHRDPRPLKHVLLYPSLRPKELQGEPWSTGFRYLQSCLGCAKVAVIIGTSLRDAHVSDILTSALAANTGLALVFVSPSCDHEEWARRVDVAPSRVTAVAADFGGAFARRALPSVVWRLVRGSPTAPAGRTLPVRPSRVAEGSPPADR